MDIDLLGLNIPRDEEQFRTILSDILSIELEDGLSFDIQTMNLREIVEGVDYRGQRLKVLCRLGPMKTNLKLDIGFWGYNLSRSCRDGLPDTLGYRIIQDLSLLT